jgi:protein SCO1
MKSIVLCAAVLLSLPCSCWGAQEYSATGMVLRVDPAHRTLVVSCESVPGFMSAMIMPFEVRDAQILNGITPGQTIEFSLVVEKDSTYAERIQIRRYESVEQDPLIARRLKLLTQLSHPGFAKPVEIGQLVPNFTLTDQDHHQVALSDFSDKVIAVNFIYTSCALPKFCFRNTNTFSVLQKRFRERMGRELILLTVTFDPQRDSPDALANYAKTWKADSATWHFLTGSVPDIRRVTEIFGVDYFPDEGLMDHSLHTAIIDRRSRLVANIEGNQFSAVQLGDLVETVMERGQAPIRAAHNQNTGQPVTK